MRTSAQTNDVVYIERQGNGASRVFAVTVAAQKKEEDMKNEVCYKVINELLFKGVENYNGGRPLSDLSNPFAQSLIDRNKLLYKGYCKEIYPENSNREIVGHYIVVVNHFNLHRVLNLRKALAQPFEE